MWYGMRMNKTAAQQKTSDGAVLPVISCADFFALPLIVSLQNVQKQCRYGSVYHAKAGQRMREIAAQYVTADGKSCASFFGAY